mmetsp:Transcript_36653/g.84526  ORF Transcript_36653/g.84526 Transcript_36653/m.84526 type:complete len:242 (+) Transcript_36653:304-1029(+)
MTGGGASASSWGVAASAASAAAFSSCSRCLRSYRSWRSARPSFFSLRSFFSFPSPLSVLITLPLVSSSFSSSTGAPSTFPSCGLAISPRFVRLEPFSALSSTKSALLVAFCSTPPSATFAVFLFGPFFWMNFTASGLFWLACSIGFLSAGFCCIKDWACKRVPGASSSFLPPRGIVFVLSWCAAWMSRSTFFKGFGFAFVITFCTSNSVFCSCCDPGKSGGVAVVGLGPGAARAVTGAGSR